MIIYGIRFDYYGECARYFTTEEKAQAYIDSDKFYKDYFIDEIEVL